MCFYDPETTYRIISTYDIEPSVREVWDIEELCASAHIYEAVNGLRKLENN